MSSSDSSTDTDYDFTNDEDKQRWRTKTLRKAYNTVADLTGLSRHELRQAADLHPLREREFPEDMASSAARRRFKAKLRLDVWRSVRRWSRAGGGNTSRRGGGGLMCIGTRMIILVEDRTKDAVTDALDERVVTILGAVMSPAAIMILLMKVHLEEAVSDALQDALGGSLEEDTMMTSAATMDLMRGTMEDRVGDQDTAVDLAKGQGQGPLADLLQAPTVVADLVDAQLMVAELVAAQGPAAGHRKEQDMAVDLVDAQGLVADPLEAQAIPKRSIVSAITKSSPSSAAIHVTGDGWDCQGGRGIAPARVPARVPTRDPTHGPTRVAAAMMNVSTVQWLHLCVTSSSTLS